ncbi:MAG: hypothetical protein CVU72_03685 [Deltaproteobacteria bacterium HGW-Deltaproteobacteria-7]|nr:MAG: hypothetical protein CVU72_03685 [Deltaproteobacteria bacterium HGW-Deltaproteobacteria-7]PKN20705.1 MAG: hypothetical protein CVU71_02670 [Deltaproteobacteria bacterium HGW-Deltaproteobacteria-6]
MKKKTVVNTLMISSILLVLYFFIGHGFVEFYFGGKKEILQTADVINNLCNANGSCPLILENWEGENGRLRKGRKMYMTIPIPGNENNEKSLKPQSFKLIYVMSFPTDDWFEVQGGVGRKVTSGWTGR